MKKIESGTGLVAFHHDGLRKRVNTTQTGPPVTKNVKNVNTMRKGMIFVFQYLLNSFTIRHFLLKIILLKFKCKKIVQKCNEY